MMFWKYKKLYEREFKNNAEHMEYIERLKDKNSAHHDKWFDSLDKFKKYKDNVIKKHQEEVQELKRLHKRELHRYKVATGDNSYLVIADMMRKFKKYEQTNNLQNNIINALKTELKKLKKRMTAK